MPVGSWRDQILKEFTPGVSHLTLVADPDGLLWEPDLSDSIRARGFDLIAFEDSVAFRYVYESKFRVRWDRGDDIGLVVVLRSASNELSRLPYDLWAGGRRLSFALTDFFPNLSYPVVAALDRADLDALFDAQQQYAPEPLGDVATKDFVLRYVFEIAPELIKEPKDLLRVLLRRHYRAQHIPPILDDRLIQVLRQKGLFDDWPLEIIIPDRQAFFAFLQERWPVFLALQVAPTNTAVQPYAVHYATKFPGPLLLPFDHPDVRVYIDTLFLEGILQPVRLEHAEALAHTWAAVGIRVSPEEGRRRRMEGLLNAVETMLPSLQARHAEWLHFAYRWAELLALVFDPEGALPSKEYREHFEAVRDRMEVTFTQWMGQRYASLINLPAAPPVMLHHIPRFLARCLAQHPHTKIALLLVDGLALDQWVVLRKVLAENHTTLRFREEALFAWIPTITAVSRQAALAGQPPMYFPTSIHTTEKERSLWIQFWVDQGMAPDAVTYVKALGHGNPGLVVEALSRSRLRVLAVVIDTVDRIMHGMELGTAGMYNQVRQWVRQGFLGDLLSLLHDGGFQVYLTSDHGNIEARGAGAPTEGAVADLRGTRVRVYRDAKLREQIRARFPDSLAWLPVGLPEDYFALLAWNRSAFVPAGERVVAHGGISLEEVIVPWIQIARAETG